MGVTTKAKKARNGWNNSVVTGKNKSVVGNANNNAVGNNNAIDDLSHGRLVEIFRRKQKARRFVRRADFFWHN